MSALLSKIYSSLQIKCFPKHISVWINYSYYRIILNSHFFPIMAIDGKTGSVILKLHKLKKSLCYTKVTIDYILRNLSEV